MPRTRRGPPVTVPRLKGSLSKAHGNVENAQKSVAALEAGLREDLAHAVDILNGAVAPDSDVIAS